MATTEGRRAPGAAVLAVALGLALAGAARGHDPGLSEIVVSLRPGGVEAVWWIAEADLGERAAATRAALRLEIDGAAAEPARAELRPAWDGHRELRLAWPRAPRERVRVTAALLARLPLGHRVYVRLFDGSGGVAEAMLSAQSPDLEHRLGRAAPQRTP